MAPVEGSCDFSCFVNSGNPEGVQDAVAHVLIFSEPQQARQLSSVGLAASQEMPVRCGETVAFSEAGQRLGSILAGIQSD